MALQICWNFIHTIVRVLIGKAFDFVSRFAKRHITRCFVLFGASWRTMVFL